MDPFQLEADVTAAKENVAKQRALGAEDLAKAGPALKQAAEALDILDKKDFQVLKALKAPPGGVGEVCAAVMHLHYNKVNDTSWNASRRMMAKPAHFLVSLRDEVPRRIDDGKLPKENVEAARKIKDACGNVFTYEMMLKKSSAAAGLCEWVINIIAYYDVVMTAKPQALREAEEALNEANARLAEAKRNPNQDKALAAFKACDANGDGTISEGELKSALLKLGMTEKDIAVAFKAADANLDGAIDYEEFIAWVYANPHEAVQKVVPSDGVVRPTDGRGPYVY